MYSIIKAGVDPHEKYISKCPFCGTVFEYEWDDIKDNEISAWHEHHVICPVCSHEMAWNTNAKRTKELVCDSTIITRFTYTQIIPEGARAFQLRLMGPELRLVEIDTIIPAGMPVLLVGTFDHIDEVAGLGSELPQGDQGEKVQIVQVDVNPGQKLLTVDANFKLRYIDSADKTPFGIIATRLSANTPVKVFEL